MPASRDATTRDDIELVLDGLPEPINLEIDGDTNIMYWTDRGDPPFGNTLNKIAIAELGKGQKSKPTVIGRRMHEAIGLKLDHKNQHIYTTDLGGTVYRSNMDGIDKKKVYNTKLSFTGITLMHMAD